MDTADWVAITLMVVGAILSLTGAGAVVGIPMVVIGLIGLIISRTTAGIVGLINVIRGNTDQSQAATLEEGVLFSSRDHDTIEAGSFVNYEFTLQQPAVLDYRVEVLGNKPMNVILTTADERERFDYRQDIRFLEKGTEFETTKAEIKSRLKPGEYSIIIDNTGRWKDMDGDTPIDIEIEYEVRE